MLCKVKLCEHGPFVLYGSIRLPFPLYARALCCLNDLRSTFIVLNNVGCINDYAIQRIVQGIHFTSKGPYYLSLPNK